MTEQVFPGTLDALAPIRDHISSAASAVGLSRSAIYNLCLAVDEIATNIVIHGYEEAGLIGDIKVRTGIEGKDFVVRLEDRGKPYNPNEHKMPAEEDLSLPLEDRLIGGLGIFLAKNSVQDLQYSTGEGGNVHRFVVGLPEIARGMNG